MNFSVRKMEQQLRFYQQCVFLLAKCVKKHLWKNDILSKDAGH